MKRLTSFEIIGGQVHDIPIFELQDCMGAEQIVKRLAAIEDILGDDYDLDRLRELVEADREDRLSIEPKWVYIDEVAVLTRENFKRVLKRYKKGEQDG